MSGYHVVLVDAGTGNLHSVSNTLRSLDIKVLVSADPHDLLRPGRVILPGVGAFGAFMRGLRERGLDQAVCDVVRRGDPLLGICVGMQALFTFSEESGGEAGLDLLKGVVRHFPAQPDLKIPHTGWNQLEFRRPSPLFAGIVDGSYAYFNHSYYCAAENPADVIAQTGYGSPFCSAVQRDALYGVQFHPEKSQRVGRAMLENFVMR